MTVTVTTPVTGGLQTGMTTPAWTIVTDVAPDINGKQYAVTALASGSAAGVRFHSISDPYTVTISRPKNPRVLPSPNAVTGNYGAIPKNVSTIIVRKGVNFAANQAPQLMLVRCEISTPAGADAYDSANVRAAISLLIGALNQQSAGLGDTIVTGVL